MASSSFLSSLEPPSPPLTAPTGQQAATSPSLRGRLFSPPTNAGSSFPAWQEVTPRDAVAPCLTQAPTAAAASVADPIPAAAAAAAAPGEPTSPPGTGRPSQLGKYRKSDGPYLEPPYLRSPEAIVAADNVKNIIIQRVSPQGISAMSFLNPSTLVDRAFAGDFGGKREDALDLTRSLSQLFSIRLIQIIQGRVDTLFRTAYPDARFSPPVFRLQGVVGNYKSNAPVFGTRAPRRPCV